MHSFFHLSRPKIAKMSPWFSEFLCKIICEELTAVAYLEKEKFNSIFFFNWYIYLNIQLNSNLLRRKSKSRIEITYIILIASTCKYEITKVEITILNNKANLKIKQILVDVFDNHLSNRNYDELFLQLFINLEGIYARNISLLINHSLFLLKYIYKSTSIYMFIKL